MCVSLSTIPTKPVSVFFFKCMLVKHVHVYWNIGTIIIHYIQSCKCNSNLLYFHKMNQYMRNLPDVYVYFVVVNYLLEYMSMMLYFAQCNQSF